MTHPIHLLPRGVAHGRTGRLGFGRRAFTLLEMTIVVAILAIIAGAALMAYDSTGDAASKDLVRHDMGVLAQAIRQFKADMGEPPQFIAELLQSPATNLSHSTFDGLGGWWWRTQAGAYMAPYPAANLWSFDPTVRRGWRGPYLRIEGRSAAGAEWAEGRRIYVAPAGPIATDVRTSNSAAGQFMTGIHCPLLGFSYILDSTTQDGTTATPRQFWIRCVDAGFNDAPGVGWFNVGVKPFDVVSP